MALCQIGSVGRDLVSDNAILHVLLIWQAEMLFGRDIAQHGGSVPTDHGGTDRAGNVVVSGSYIGCQRAKSIKRSFMRELELKVHVLLDQMHRHMPRTFNHHLAVTLPRDLGKFSEGGQLAELRVVIGVRN